VADFDLALQGAVVFLLFFIVNNIQKHKVVRGVVAAGVLLN
jgi:hypothetical protein